MFEVKEKYEDFLGNEREETFRFNLTKADITKLEMSEKGGLTRMLERVIETKDNVELVKLFAKFLDLSYGVVSPDGRNFVKNENVLADFQSTNAYSQIYMRLGTDSQFAADFINGIIPKDIAEELAKNGELEKALGVKPTEQPALTVVK